MGGVVGFTAAYTASNNLFGAAANGIASTFTNMGFGIFVLNCDIVGGTGINAIQFWLVGQQVNGSYNQTYLVTNVNTINAYANYNDTTFTTWNLSNPTVYGVVIYNTTLTALNLAIMGGSTSLGHTGGTAAGFRDTFITVNLDGVSNNYFNTVFNAAIHDYEYPFADISHRQVIINNPTNGTVMLVDSNVDLSQYKAVIFKNGFEIDTNGGYLSLQMGTFIYDTTNGTTDNHPMVWGSLLSVYVINTFSNTRAMTINSGGRLYLGSITGGANPVRTPVSTFLNTGVITVNGVLTVY